MPLRALSIAATGAAAMQNTIDTIANNVANVNTHSFKRSRANFADLFYQEVQRAGSGTAGINQKPTGLAFGTGVKLTATEKLFSQGDLDRTDRELDVAVSGEGFLRVTLPDGTLAYTRSGALKTDSDGNLVTAEGYLLDPQITIPQGVSRISIDTTGKIQGFDQTDPQTLQDVGQIELTRFINPSGLDALGDNLYRVTPASGSPIDGQPSAQGFGELRQGFLESSNVDVVKELVDLISAQRAFEINGQSIQAADQILQAVNNLRR